jgi:hypothetical protein
MNDFQHLLTIDDVQPGRLQVLPGGWNRQHVRATD